MAGLSIKPIKKQTITFTIKGTSSLIQHKWSDKALKQIRDKKQGKKTKAREPLDIKAEVEAATYLTDDGEYGIPIMAFKNALIAAAHKDIGIEKTLVRKSLFFPCSDSNMVIPINAKKPKTREDYVRVGSGGADLRYRPEFTKWSADILIEFDAEMLTPQDIFSLVNRAGFGVGIGEWRPEKNGENGRFCVDESKPTKVADVK